MQDCSHRLIDASGESVGLPGGQIGNSEVGHLHLGAGRLLQQDLTRINSAIESGAFSQNPVLQEAIARAQHSSASIHIIGLVSDGGVHSSDNHFHALLNTLAAAGINNCQVHAFLDGRDVNPKSAASSLQKMQLLMQKLQCGQIASVIGRYYAMDRDNRWERVQLAYDLLTQAKANFTAATAVAALHQAYQRGETDEFVQATTIGPKPATINDGDVVIFMNFRADRARQLSYALTAANFNGFKRDKVVNLSEFITLTEYASDIEAKVMFPPISMKNSLGEYLSRLGLKQLRIAETEKYAHVTYFFSGGSETPFPGEDRVLIPSPKVATYDLQPEMSAPELTERLVAAIRSRQYDAIICNYANFDMVGHTGNIEAAAQAIKTIDSCLGLVLAALKEANMDTLITADHGNIECMFDENSHQPHTAHTTNFVPLVYVGERKFKFNSGPGSLADVAPTMLYLMGLKQPAEMTSHNLIELSE
jgi:2,3-bisphosphoglycerate-independent phosphoglycerate mutase